MDKNFELNLDILLDKLNKISKILIFDEIDSTNEEAKRQIDTNCPFPTLILSKSQFSGKGRQGRSFYSPKDTGIYMSLVLESKRDVRDSLLITSIASVAVRNAISSLTGTDTKIKWVNDIYQNEKKVSGILCEMYKKLSTDENFIIVGIGINLTTQFEAELKDVASSIGKVDKNLLVINIIEEILDLYEKLPNRDFIEEYKKYSNILGKDIYFIKDNEKTYGKAIDIDKDAALLVKVEDKIVKLNTGEITVRQNAN